MSRVGNQPISIPSGVTITIDSTKVVVRGQKGEVSVDLKPGISVKQEAEELIVTRSSDEQQTKAYHGLVRSLLQNAVIGVNDGYKKTLKLIGTGYRVAMKGQGLSLSVGFSHPVDVVAPAGVKFSIEGNDTIHVEGFDKGLVGQTAADIRKVRPPEPYKGKGIRYEDEVVRRKAGKAAA